MSTTDGSITFDVPRISCEHCRAAIRDAVSPLDGVERVEVDLAAKRVTVHGGGVDRDAVVAAIDEAGYEVS